MKTKHIVHAGDISFDVNT